jgi:hypothetical protein
MIDSGQYLDDLIMSVYNGYTSINYARTERVIRCFDCGDSDNQEHAHLGITLVPPFVYHCHRCGFGGIVNEEFLSRLGIKIDKRLHAIIDENRKIARAAAKKKVRAGSTLVNRILTGAFTSRKLHLPFYTEADMRRPNFRYLCDRFGVEWTLDDAKAFKLIPSLKRFGSSNYIQDWPIKEWNENRAAAFEVLNTLHEDYAGFLDYAGQEIIFRRVVESDSSRYFEMKFSKAPFRLYTISKRIPIATTRLNLILAEGIFDVIGLYNKFPEFRDSAVFAAMLGKNPDSIMDFFFKLGFFAQDVMIFKDNDVNDWKYISKIKDLVYPKKLGFTVKVLHNETGHDFGIPANEIRLDTAKRIL